MPDRNTHGLSHHGLAGLHHRHCRHAHDLDGQVVSRGGEGDQLLVDGSDQYQPQGVEVMIRYRDDV